MNVCMYNKIVCMAPGVKGSDEWVVLRDSLSQGQCVAVVEGQCRVRTTPP